MISNGDRIAVGLSGGHDSLTLLWLLRERLRRIPVQYEIVPIYIDPGFEPGFGSDLKDYCRLWGLELRVEETRHGILAHSTENRENPCFLCSHLRRKRLFEIADEQGCRKLALGHNKDDLIETLFLNICYAGEICTMVPSQSFFQGKFTVIRPLAFADETIIRKFARENRFPVFDNPCPTSKTSKRKEIKEMLNRLYQGNTNVKGNIFRALSHVRTDYLLKDHSKRRKRSGNRHEPTQTWESGHDAPSAL
ncbi:MAG: tRNA 2-thiocytidine(32) synthetase TtcA [Deltaproteobacteria bacterium]|nr:tRNA 2-thiocytidine(32) synthetase TtcA [Deltaproteobacteria bacterium]